MASATISALAAGLIGLGIGNTRLKKYEQAIEEGHILILLDIPINQIDKFNELITKHHPEVNFEGMEPILPPSY
jgi:hypothetical protein